MGEELPEDETSNGTDKKVPADGMRPSLHLGQRLQRLNNWPFADLNIKASKDEDLDEVTAGDDEHTHRVLGGYKATLKSEFDTEMHCS